MWELMRRRMLKGQRTFEGEEVLNNSKLLDQITVVSLIIKKLSIITKTSLAAR